MSLFLSKLLPQQFSRVLLVASALHMPRVLTTFRSSAGINAIPSPTDFEAINKQRTILGWLPNAEALEQTTRAFKKYLDIAAYYRWCGSIKS